MMLACTIATRSVAAPADGGARKARQARRAVARRPRAAIATAPIKRRHACTRHPSPRRAMAAAMPSLTRISRKVSPAAPPRSAACRSHRRREQPVPKRVAQQLGQQPTRRRPRRLRRPVRAAGHHGVAPPDAARAQTRSAAAAAAAPAAATPPSPGTVPMPVKLPTATPNQANTAATKATLITSAAGQRAGDTCASHSRPATTAPASPRPTPTPTPPRAYRPEQQAVATMPASNAPAETLQWRHRYVMAAEC